jgi:hypothetical protein
MKHRKQMLALFVLTLLVLAGFFPAGSAWGQPAPQPEPGPAPPVLQPEPQPAPTPAPTPIALPAPPDAFFVSTYFVDATNDGSYLITNTGEDSFDLCALIYVLNASGQMIECCSCPVKPSALLTLSVNHDLTGNPQPSAPDKWGGQDSVVRPEFLQSPGPR